MLFQFGFLTTFGTAHLMSGETDCNSCGVDYLSPGCLMNGQSYCCCESLACQMGFTRLEDVQAELFEGESLVAFPDDYDKMVEKLILEKRGQYACLDGWLGPRRFKDLPVHAMNISLPSTHADEKIAKGLETVQRLDEELHDKTLDAYIVDRETFPNKWEMEERARLRRQKRNLDRALKWVKMLLHKCGRCYIG